MMAPTKGKEKEGEEEVLTENQELMKILGGVAKGIESLTEDVAKLSKRVSTIETGGVDKFKDGAKKEDVERVAGNREHVDPKIVAIVNEMLGEDFGVEVKPLGDRPGFRFSVIVPHRLSDNIIDKRPVKDEATGQYKKDEGGQTIFEDYIPEDRRSRIISSTDSYDAIKGHCERVRAYIVAYFQKVSKPLPEFKVK